MVNWNDVKNAVTYLPRAIKTDSGRLYGGAKEVWNNGAAADPDVTRRDLIKGSGLFLAAGATPGAAIVEDTSEASPVGVRNPFTVGDDDPDSQNDQLPNDRSSVDSNNGVDDGSNLDYSQEMCAVHAELERDVQRDIEGYLRTVSEVDGDEIESISVSGNYMDSNSERFAPVELTGTQGGQDQFGASEEYAELLEEAYSDDEGEFYDGLNNILEGDCN